MRGELKGSEQGPVMNNVKSLGAIVFVAFVITLVYGLAFDDRGAANGFDFDDGNGIRHVVSGDRGDFTLRVGDLSIEATWRGEYALNDNGNDIARLDRTLEIRREDGETKERAIFEERDGGVARSFYRDGEKLDDAQEAGAAARALLLTFLRGSGAKADERIAALSAKGGAAAVLEEMGMLEGDHAKQRYTTALTQAAALTPDEIGALANIIAGMDGDHELRLAISAVVENQTPGPEELERLLAAAAKIESDYDARRLIENIAEQTLDDDAALLALGLMDGIDSDHDLHRAAEALLARKTLTADKVARILTAAGGKLDSDHELKMLLTDTVHHLGEDIAAAAWIDAVAAIDSDHDKRRVIEAATELERLNDGTLIALLAAARDISSDHEKKNALSALAHHVADRPALIAAYRVTAETISSERDRDNALAALEKQ